MSRVNFTRNFTTLRKSNNLTQEKMAERLDVSRQTVTNWERGRNAPDVHMLDIICSEFDISMDELLYGNNNSADNYNEEKLDKILNEIASLKKKINTPSLFDMYKSSVKRNYDEELKDIDFCGYGDAERSRGNYNKALNMYETAAMYGDINGVLSAIDLRREILELCEDNMSFYYSELSIYASKLLEYGSILADVVTHGDLL